MTFATSLVILGFSYAGAGRMSRVIFPVLLQFKAVKDFLTCFCIIKFKSNIPLVHLNF